MIVILIDKAPFKCPMCRAVFEVPTTTTDENQEGNGTVSSLPSNHFVTSMLAAAATTTSLSSPLSKGQADPNNVVCDICEKEQASEFCKECAQDICDTCKKRHLKTRANIHHQFTSLDEALTPGGGGGLASRITPCEKHPQQEINSYCHTDQQAVCPECVVDTHLGHQVERLVNVMENHKTEISRLLNQVCVPTSVFCFPQFHFFLTSDETRSRNMTASYQMPSRLLQPRSAAFVSEKK